MAIPAGSQTTLKQIMKKYNECPLWLSRLLFPYNNVLVLWLRPNSARLYNMYIQKNKIYYRLIFAFIKYSQKEIW